jgi:hypothetical protein
MNFHGIVRQGAPRQSSIVVGALDAGSQRVPPAKRHVPVRATNLQFTIDCPKESHTVALFLVLAWMPVRCHGQQF